LYHGLKYTHSSDVVVTGDDDWLNPWLGEAHPTCNFRLEGGIFDDLYAYLKSIAPKKARFRFK